MQIYEKRFRPEEMWYQPWLDRQVGRVTRALAELEVEPPMMGKPPHVGHITLACALGYLDFRFDGQWREGALGFDRVLLLFDGTQRDAAAELWRRFAQDEQIDNRINKQDESGAWREGR